MRRKFRSNGHGHVCGLFFQVGQAGGVQHQVAMGGVQLQPQALQGDMNMPGILERHQHSCLVP